MQTRCDLTIAYSLNELNAVANQVLKSVKSKTILFYGNMGTGKTTLIKALIEALGSDDDVSSPTYSIVNEYSLSDNVIYHFDLYRLKSIEEAYDFGIEDYLQTEGWLFIEWPELIKNHLDVEYDIIELSISEQNKRILTLK
ncbi:tRNA (adenosine(37)-N6)-threonylcarbamoyltransferase complex ATPase subunit type 1 TsaE [Hanstruepera ponticola]|uniref:tRNA (adenosine(37)-N6)-threonylcarbamoyltransferase complex ATPase subunit type 1 TsaE n=1 Tax=Hanstruepera ponticola TaxID=2042995 RepID=UPI001EEE8441|nr:tRNA (adenosine(37)-N6)-threonylcarbamoyltransferase complex ATPase subunit type 1 TsaE [Hanstruepera ponticola]